MTRRDLEMLVEKAMTKRGAHSHRDLSLKMGWAHNYVHNILKGTVKPSEEALAALHEAAGVDPTLPVLTFMRDKHDGSVRKIIDRAIKALTAASLALLVLAGTTREQSAHASTVTSSNVYIMRQMAVQLVRWIRAFFTLHMVVSRNVLVF